MELKRYLLLVILEISASNAYVEIIPDKKNWSEAKNECVHRGGRLSHLEELNSNTCTDKSINVWLDVRMTPWIAKKGCYKREEKEKNPKDNVLKCYRFCKTTPFGYKKPRCYCEKEANVELKADSACIAGVDNFLWLYDKSDIDVLEDDDTKNCISAQCTANGTIFKADSCISEKYPYCQRVGSILSNTGKNTQTMSEKNCNVGGNSDHLIVNQICASSLTGDSNPEFWTGIQRYQYADKQNCVYVRCENGIVPIENTEDCGLQKEGFACSFNGTAYNVTTELPIPESSLASTLISSHGPILLHVESTSENSKSSSSLISTRTTKANNTSSTAYIIVGKNKSETEQKKSSPGSSVLQTLVTSPKPITLHFESTSETFESFTDEANTNTGSTLTSTYNIDTSTLTDTKSETDHSESEYINSTTTRNSYSRSHTSKTESTSETLEHSSEDANKTSLSSSPNTRSTETNNIDMSTLAYNMYNTAVKNKSETDHSASKIIYNTTTLNSYTRSHTSKTGNSILPTSVTSETTSDQDQVSAFMNTSSKLPFYSNIDMSSTSHSSVLNNKSGTDLHGSKKIPSTVTRPPNDSSSDQLSTGLIVGISVSMLSLLVLIIGIFGICRLRKQRAFKENSLDFSTPINTMKETKVIENDSTHPVVSANDDDKSFRPTDTTSNGNTSKPNDPYAVVVKKPVTNKADTTSNGKESKSNNVDDPYAFVVKIPEKNQFKDEQTSLDIPESAYDSTHQPRSISDNESCNIYDTSRGHCDDYDPTYNMTSHILEREENNESDYDHL